MSDEYALVAVGGGPAALATVRAYRQAGGAGPVAMITDEQRMPYNRPPLSKELLREEMTEDQLVLEEERWLEEQGVDLVTARAVKLEPESHHVVLSGGRRLAYRQAVLASGAEPQRLPVPGAFHPGVRVLRSLDDLRELRSRLRGKLPIVVIGSGFIGCEIAVSLRMMGHPVTLVSDETAPNVRRLGEEAGLEIAAWLREENVELLLGEEVEGVERAGEGLRVLTETSSATGHVVIMAVGVAPRSELAAMAGAELDEGAVITDRALRTSVDGLLAAGDVCAADNAAAGRRLRVEHWGDALGQGSVAGRTAAGVEANWDAVPGFWSSIGQRTLKYSAWGDGYDEVRFERAADGAFRVWYGREGRLVGVLAHQDDDAYDRGGELIEAGAAWR